MNTYMFIISRYFDARTCHIKVYYMYMYVQTTSTTFLILVKDLLDLWTMKGRRSYFSN